VRHLVRWHRRLPDAPDVRLVALAAALVMAFVAIPDAGLVAFAPEALSTPVAPTTAFDRSAGSLTANSLGVLADVRWRVVKPPRPVPSPEPATVVPTGCDPVAVELAQSGADSVSRDELAALMAVQEPQQVSLTLDTDCPDAGAVLSWYLNAQELAATARAADRAEARGLARAAQQRADQKAKLLAARRAAGRRAAQHAAVQRAAALAAARRAAQRRAAAKRAAANQSGSGTTSGGWRIAPIVTWYGPGFYGNRTACGVPYTRTIVGVAHRTLPCGTLVRFKWHGITAVAPVIDRGPYATAAYVFDFSAALSCNVFKPRGISNSCFTRHDVQYQVVGKVNLKQYLAAHGH
jgi:hypothetical protein